MTAKIKPATDEQIATIETSGYQHIDAASLIARIRLEQRRAEAAEKVVEAFRGRRPYSIRGEVMIADTSAMMDAITEYDAAKAAGFPKED